MARNLPRFGKKIFAEVGKKAPILLPIAGGILLGAAVIFAAIESKEAEKRKEELREHGVELKKFDYLKALAPCYKKTIMIGATGVGCLACGTYVSARRIAATVIAEEATRHAYKATRKAIFDVAGEEIAAKIDGKVAEDYNPGLSLNGTVLFIDRTMGGSFRSTVFDVRNAFNDANEILNAQDSLSFNDFLELLGRKPIGNGDCTGFSKKQDPAYGIEILPTSYPGDWGTELDPVTGEPAIVLQYTAPWERYDRNF